MNSIQSMASIPQSAVKENNIPQRKEYKVGDTFKVVNYGFSMSQYSEGMILNRDQQVFEVEIKDIKNVKVTLE